jgi:hypothetical protein
VHSRLREGIGVGIGINMREYTELVGKSSPVVVCEYVEGKGKEAEEGWDEKKLVFNPQVRWMITFGMIVCTHAGSRTAYILGGVGHCFAWHVRVPSSCNLFIFIISMNMT